MTTTRPPSAHGLLPLLRLSGLRKLVLIRMLGALGDGAFQGALANAVLLDPSRRTTAAEIAAGFAVVLLPYSLVGPFAGALLDRWSRRQVLVWANLLRAVIVAGLSLLLLTRMPLWLLFSVALLVMGTGRFVGSGLSAAMPHVVSADSLVGGNSLSTSVGSIATVIGGGCALGLRGILGPGDHKVALVTGSVLVFYLCAAAVSARFGRTALGPDETDEPPQPILAVLQGLSAGLTHIAHRPRVGLSIGMVMLVRFSFGLATLVVLLLFRHTFTQSHGLLRGGAAGLGEVLAVSGIGLFLGAVATAPLVAWLGRTRFVVVLLVLAACVVAGLGTNFTIMTTMLAALVMAFAYQCSKICADTVVQTDADDAHLGRVFALYDTGNNVCYVLAFVLGVWIVPPDGRGQFTVFLVAAVYLAIAAMYGWGMRRRDRAATP